MDLKMFLEPKFFCIYRLVKFKKLGFSAPLSGFCIFFDDSMDLRGIFQGLGGTLDHFNLH